MTEARATEVEGATAGRSIPWGKAACLAGIVLYVLVFTGLQVRLYRGLHMGITDLGYFDQSMYNAVHGNGLLVSFDVPSEYRLRQSSNSSHLFAQHPFVLMPGLVLPLYALVPHTYTLFVVQAIAAAAGALPIYLLAREKTGREWPAVALSLAFLLHPTLQFITVNMFTFGFHPENLFPGLFLFAFYFLHRRNWALFAVFFLLSVLVVESYTLVTAALGAYVVLRRPRRPWLGLAMIAVSLGWLALSLAVIVPHFKTGGGSPWFVSDMKGGAVLAEKLAAVPALIGPFLRYAAQLLGPFLFTPLAGPGLLAVALPILAVNFSALLIGYEAPASYTGWQSNPVVAVVALAAVWGVAGLLRRLPRQGPAVPAFSAAILAAAILCDVWYGPLPFSPAVAAGQYDVDEPRAAAVCRLAALIPESAVLSADYYLGSQFTRRPSLFWFPDHWAQADYVLIDRSSEWSAVYAQPVAWLENSPYHEVAFDYQDMVLYRRLPDRPELPAFPLDANFGDVARLSGYTLDPAAPHPGDVLRVTLFWQAAGASADPYTVFVHLLDPSGRMVAQEDSMPMSNQHPTTDWMPGEAIVDRYYDLPLSADAPAGEYSLEIGLYHQPIGQRLDLLDAMGNPRDARLLVPGIQVASP